MSHLISLTDQAWAVLLPVARAIYEQAFEPDEKAPFEGLLAAACRPPGENPIHFWGLVEGEELLATAWFCTLPAERLGYLGYLATASASRGRGYGGRLLRQVLAAMRDRLLADTGQPPLAIFWEVRSLEDAPDEEERLLRLRRIRFYQRFGAQTLDVDYLCPPVAPGQPEVKFSLMAVTDPPGQPLSQALLTRIVLAGLVKMEGADPESEYVRRALASIH